MRDNNGGDCPRTTCILHVFYDGYKNALREYLD